VRTVHAHKANILSLHASTKLAEQWGDVSEAVEEMKGLLAKGIEGHIKMETAPLVFSNYVQEEEVSKMESTYSKLVFYLSLNSEVI